MGWVKSGHWPNLLEWQQLAILVCAMTATVLSWDGYLLSIERRPLIGLLGFWRFTIDIFLVFIYMFLLMTSYHPTWWLTIHAITYTLYAIWDLLSVFQYTKQYYPDGIPDQQVTVLGIYWRGLWSISTESYGPIITVAWGGYFWGLVLLNRGSLADRVFVTSVFALAGLSLYRLDKNLRFSMIPRIGMVIVLLILDSLYINCGSQITDHWLWGLFRQ